MSYWPKDKGLVHIEIKLDYSARTPNLYMVKSHSVETGVRFSLITNNIEPELPYFFVSTHLVTNIELKSSCIFLSIHIVQLQLIQQVLFYIA